MRIYGFIISSTLFIQGAVAMDYSVDWLLEQHQPVQAIEKLKREDPSEAQKLCEKIKSMGQEFYDKVSRKGIGVIARNKIMGACSGLDLKQQENVKKAVQKEKIQEKPKESVKLRPVIFSKSASSGVEAQQAELKEAQAVILENAEKLGKKAEFEEKLRKADGSLKEAQEHYDNLSVAISILREDVNTMPGKLVKEFSSQHKDDTAENYLQAVKEFQAHNKDQIQDGGQIGAALEVLTEANKNLAEAKKELEAINREMMRLVS